MTISNPVAMLDEAERLLNAGQTGSAGDICREVLYDAPGDARAVLLAARALRTDNRQAEAVSILQSIPAEEMTADICLELGTCLQQLGRLEASRSLFLRAVEKSPDGVQAVKRLSRVNSLLGHHEEAAECCIRLIGVRPEGIFQVYPNLVRALLSAGQSLIALEYCDKVLAINPASRFALALKYIALANLGRIEGARDLINADEYVKQIDLACPPGFDGVADFNACLTDHILHHTRLLKDPQQYSTRGGWQSVVGRLFEKNAMLGRTMMHVIGNALDEYLRRLPAGYKQQGAWKGFGSKGRRIESWAVVLERQGVQDPHIHPSSWLSGAYYINVPDAEDSLNPDAGNFVVGRGPDYLQVSSEPLPSMVTPVPGEFCIFPSYYWHNTVPVESRRQRICIAFDWVM
jgi:tetratricopeptide (TPR) repeat protein